MAFPNSLVTTGLALRGSVRLRSSDLWTCSQNLNWDTVKFNAKLMRSLGTMKGLPLPAPHNPNYFASCATTPPSACALHHQAHVLYNTKLMCSTPPSSCALHHQAHVLYTTELIYSLANMKATVPVSILFISQCKTLVVLGSTMVITPRS